MKILFSCGSKSWGGLEMQTLNLAISMRNKGHNVMLLVPINSTLLQRAEKENLNIKSLNWKNSQTLLNWRKVRKTIKSFKPDIIHMQLSHDLWVLSPAISRNDNVKLIFTRRMASGISKKDWFHRWIYKKVDLVLCISTFIKENVMRTMPISPEKIRVHYNGLNFSKFDYTLFDKAESKAVWGINPDELVIGFLGRFSMMKGHQEFFEAGKILLENYPEKKIKFLVAGGDSFGEKEFGEITREFGKNLLGDQVIYTGSIENTPKVLSAMDILAFPSHEESFGNVLCEAAAMEIAVVASRSGGVPDIVKDQETGILVEPKNSESLAKGISVYIESEDLRNIHGKNARLYVMRKFADDKQLEELENIYKELTLDV